MKVHFIEKVINLKDLDVGQYAVSRDRSEVFCCGYFAEKDGKEVKQSKVILKLNNLTDQYSDNWNMNQPVILLSKANVVSLQIFTE